MTGKKQEHSKCQNHASDACLYAYIKCRHFWTEQHEEEDLVLLLEVLNMSTKQKKKIVTKQRFAESQVAEISHSGGCWITESIVKKDFRHFMIPKGLRVQTIKSELKTRSHCIDEGDQFTPAKFVCSGQKQEWVQAKILDVLEYQAIMYPSDPFNMIKNYITDATVAGWGTFWIKAKHLKRIPKKEIV